MLSVVAVLALVASACVPVCVGTACSCPEGQTCNFAACDANTSSCQLDCAKDASCTGTCGTNCQVTCAGKECTASVGASSQVTCTSGTCNITCNGSCSVAASGGSLSLTCKGGTQTPGGCS